MTEILPQSEDDDLPPQLEELFEQEWQAMGPDAQAASLAFIGYPRESGRPEKSLTDEGIDLSTLFDLMRLGFVEKLSMRMLAQEFITDYGSEIEAIKAAREIEKTKYASERNRSVIEVSDLERVYDFHQAYISAEHSRQTEYIYRLSAKAYRFVLSKAV